MLSRKSIEEKARQIASGTFSDGTMRTMLYERIVQAFAEHAAPRPLPPPTDDPPPRCPACGDHRHADCGQQ